MLNNKKDPKSHSIFSSRVAVILTNLLIDIMSAIVVPQKYILIPYSKSFKTFGCRAVGDKNQAW